MTAAELYEHNAGFRGFLAVWDRDRRCPLELVDYLIDRDMAGPAECARWAATKNQRRVWGVDGNEHPKSYPYPAYTQSLGWYYLLWYEDGNHESNVVLESDMGEQPRGFDRNIKSPTPTGAHVALMDAWVVPVPA